MPLRHQSDPGIAHRVAWSGVTEDGHAGVSYSSDEEGDGAAADQMGASHPALLTVTAEGTMRIWVEVTMDSGVGRSFGPALPVVRLLLHSPCQSAVKTDCLLLHIYHGFTRCLARRGSHSCSSKHAFHLASGQCRLSWCSTGMTCHWEGLLDSSSSSCQPAGLIAMYIASPPARTLLWG